MTKRITTRELSQMALFVALMAVCSWITIPLPWVPITMQVFGVFLALCTMGGQKGTVCVFTYILLGAVGAPVFSGFRGGIGVLLGTTGGYIVGFIPMAMLFWLLTAVIRREHPAIRFGIMVLCLACLRNCLVCCGLHESDRGDRGRHCAHAVCRSVHCAGHRQNSACHVCCRTDPQAGTDTEPIRRES